MGEIETLRGAAGRILEVAGSKDDAGSTLAAEELARMDAQLLALRERQDAVSAEIELLEGHPTTEGALADELEAFDRIWVELVPAEQERLVRLTVERVVVRQDGIDLVLRADGVAGLARELRGAGAAGERIGVETSLEAANG